MFLKTKMRAVKALVRVTLSQSFRIFGMATPAISGKFYISPKHLLPPQLRLRSFLGVTLADG